MTRRRRTPPPLPQLDGIDPVRVRMPADGTWATVRDHLVARLAPPAEVIDAMLRDGAVVDAAGRPVAPGDPYVPGGSVWFHRMREPEPVVPFPVRVVHRDDHIVVADKPHFLATTPRGSHVTETALARLRRDLGLPQLTAAHRLDRLTAGLVLFTVRPEDRGAYQRLFAEQQVRKEYEALAPHDPRLALPCTVRSRIEKVHGVLPALEVAGEPNAVTEVALAEHRGGVGRYRLVPRTGRTHQLRVHMNALGVPILGDPFHPMATPLPAGDDFLRPLQLLARELEFTDPLSGAVRRFVSGRELAEWAECRGRSE